jgi:hypothetical protein
MKLVEAIDSKNFESANDLLAEKFHSIMERKLHEMKKMVASHMSEAPDNEKFDPETGTTTKTKQNKAMITINKLGQEKKSGEPEEEGDETHLHKSTETTTSGNGRDSTSTLSTRTSQKVIRPNKNDDTGSDYEVKSDTNLDRSSSETKKPSPKKGDEYDGETPVSESLYEARINIVKARIRGGKIQRRKKVSNVPGFTLRGGKMTRMSASERRRRKLGAKIAARKTKQKKTQILRKRRLSLVKRSRLGL